MSPEEFAELEKEAYLKKVAEHTKINELATKYIGQGLDGQAAWIQANVEYDEKYPKELVEHIELLARLTYERGRQSAIISEAHEKTLKNYNFFWESDKSLSADTKELENE